MSHAGGRAKAFTLVALTILLTACSRAPEPTAPGTREVSLFHYFSFAGSFVDTMDTLAGAFNQSQQAHHLRATPIDHESFKVSVRDALVLGNTADLYTYWAGARTQAMLDTLQPFDDVLPAAQLGKLFSPTLLDSAIRYNGKVYLLPVTQHYVGFFYNKKLFAAHNLQPPRTWDELLQIGARLKARGVVPIALGAKAKWPAQFWFDYLLLRTAPLEYRERLLSGQASWTDPEVVRVFSLWRELIRSGLFNHSPNELEFDSGAAAMVHRGEAAMTLMGTWLIGYFGSTEIGWRENEDYGFFSFPVIDPALPAVALGPVDGLVLPRSAKNQEGAKAALRHFAGAPAQETLSRGTGSIAPHQDIQDSAYSPLKMAIRQEIRRSAAWAFNYDLATPPAAAEVGLNLFAEFLEFPDQYRLLLDRAEDRMKAVFASPP